MASNFANVVVALSMLAAVAECQYDSSKLFTQSGLDELIESSPGGKGSDRSGSFVGNIRSHMPHLSGTMNMLIANNFEYLQLAAQFARDTISWDGFSDYFQELSDESWENAVKLIKYASKRGQNLGTELNIPVSKKRNFDMSEGEALGFALDREKAALTHVNNLLKRSSGSSADRGSSAEPLMSHFVESTFASESTNTVRELAGLVRSFNGMSSENDALAVFHMNKLLKKLASN
jgi:ferritin